ncbi:MAG: carboxymuconolactone decarboxylase family protein [Gammaproteobacteria bacterium]|nr:carboxymuconolactone decarboxylase family protein [Gammaproteobacteria bacterium]
MNGKALISPTIPSGEEQRVEGTLNQVAQALGFVPDGLRLYGISPPLLENFVGGIGYFREHPVLRQELLAMIRYLASSEAGCQFCIDLNEGFLTSMGIELDEIRASRSDPENAPLNPNEKQLLGLTLKSLSDPEAVIQEDLDTAREHGWTDRDIFDAIVIAANNRAFNIVLKTFKIEHQGAFA